MVLKNLFVMLAHGHDSGEEWIVVEDVLFETRQNNELRVGPFDISSWDLSNRREFRSQLLIWAWLGITNTKIANFKFLFKKKVIDLSHSCVFKIQVVLWEGVIN